MVGYVLCMVCDMTGNVIGSLCGGYLASIDCSPQTHFFYVSVLCLPISLVMYYWLINSSKERKFLANGGVLMIAGGSGYVSGHSTSGGGNLFRGYSTSSSTMSNKYDDYYTSSNNPSRDYYSSGEYLIPPASYYGDDSDESEDSDTYLGADGLAAQIRNQGHSARPLLQPLYATPPTPQSYSDSQASSFMESSTQHSPQKIIRFLCILGFVSELINGTITEWCTVFFKEELNASPLMSTVGYAVFSACGAVCMLLSDMLVKRYFRQTVIRCSGCMGLVGLSLVALAGFVDTWCDIEHFPLYLAILGLAVAGGSISCVVPIVFSAAGDIPQVKPSTSVPMVTSVSYVAYQCGPPLFGYLSDVLGGLKFVFIILAGLSALLVFFPGHVPHNRYGMLMLLTSRRMKHQSTDFMWQEDSRGSTPCLAVVDHNNSTDVDDESESDSDIVSDSGATAGDGDDRYNSGRSDGSHFEEIKKKPARSNKHLYDNTSSENNTLSSGTNDSASTNNVNTSENNMNNGSKKSDKIKAINKHLSKNRFPVF